MKNMKQGLINGSFRSIPLATENLFLKVSRGTALLLQTLCQSAGLHSTSQQPII
jgi:hypothetical protein